MTPCQWIVSYQHFNAASYLHLQGSPGMLSCVVELVALCMKGVA